MIPMPPLPGDISITEESQVDNGSAASSATETTVGVRENTLARERREMKLIEKYSGGQTSTEYNTTKQETIWNPGAQPRSKKFKSHLRKFKPLHKKVQTDITKNSKAPPSLSTLIHHFQSHE